MSIIKAVKFLGELVYDIATIYSHPTGHPNFHNEAQARNFRESQKGLCGNSVAPKEEK